MTRVPLHLLPVAVLACAALSPPAFAGEVERAEHIRVSEEMRKLAGRNAWTAVEAQYRRLEELEKKGEVLDAKEHLLGAQSARALGDITSARARYARAQSTAPSQEASDSLAEIDANYGRIEVTFEPKWAGDRALVAAEPPFAPDQRAALAFAVAKVAAGEDYVGLLPAGSYSVAGKSVSVVVGQGSVASLRVERDPNAPKEPMKLAYVGPRASVGVSFTSAGGLSEAGASADAGLQAGAFGGSGARVGAGLEVGLSDTFGLIAEVGYHNLFGAPATGGERLAATDQYTVAGNNLHMGYGWLAASARFGGLWLAAGPIWGAGTGSVTGVDGYCATPGNCEDVTLTEETARYQRLTGSITAGGAAASVGYKLVDLGNLAGAITLEGGAQTDSYRLYPWGQLAFTIAPSGSREEG
jgi:hypothetical protein